MGRTAWQRCPVPTSLSGSRLCLSPFCAALTKPLSPYHLWRIKFSQFWSSEVSDQVCSRFVVVTVCLQNGDLGITSDGRKESYVLKKGLNFLWKSFYNCIVLFMR